jgi:hypothetical protein
MSSQPDSLNFSSVFDEDTVDPEKIAVIENWVVLTTVRGVPSFLGFYNFYRRLIEGYSKITRSLHAFTRKENLLH